MQTARIRRNLRIVAPARPGKPVASTDAYGRRIAEYADRIRHMVDVDDIIAVLDQALRETHQLHTVQALASAHDQVTRAELEISQLRQELQAASTLLREDPLTGALNRRGLQDAYDREAARADRHGVCLAVALLDLDDFKRLNDSFGHALGDRALVHLAAVARAGLRPNDVLARFGGEEFVLLLPDTGLGAATLAIRRMQRSLAAAPLASGGKRIAVTFSAGAAQRRRKETLEHVLRRADAVLYEAKRAGKNCVHAAA